MAKKMTYADIAEKLSNAYNKYDSALQNATTDAEKNAATLMLKRVSDRLNQLMLDNQNQANKMDQKETAPDSPNQSIAQREMRMAKGGTLKPIPPDNKGLPKLPEEVRNTMGYMKKGGKLTPKEKKLAALAPPFDKITRADVLKGRGVFQAGGQLYDGITDDQLTEELLGEAGLISGLGDQFNPRNPEHVKRLQEGLLGGYTGAGSERFLSGDEFEFINKGGRFSVNNAGIDGKFGKDTFAALKEFNDAREKPVLAIEPKQPVMLEPELPKVDLSNLAQAINIPGTPANNEIQTGTSGATGAGKTKGQAIVGKIVDGLLGATKGLEYMNDANTIRGMIAPPPMGRISPFYANTEVDINPELQAIADNQLLNLKQRKQMSTKRQNFDKNTAADVTAGARARGKLFSGKRNLENQLGMRVAAINKPIEEKNIKTDFDNEFQLADFLNQRRLANRNLFSGVVQDAQDLLTQRTNKRSQEAQLQALAPYLNMYGAMNRAYAPGYFSDPQIDALFSNLGYVKQADGSYKPA
jgi:hypothetical protein|tara:strand:- start:12058 stop:13635 length:1578 start_codon:yes stop_codon:yes gene_type:complete